MVDQLREDVATAREAFRTKDFERAFSAYRRLAEDGRPECQVFLAWMLTEGIGCARDEVEAAKYYERAASLGNPLGRFYFARWLTRQGLHEQAYPLYVLSADVGYLPAVFRVGYSLARGKGVARDLVKAYGALRS